MFCDKRLENINHNRILKLEDSNARLQRKMLLKENNLVATYSVTPSIKNKILSYKETVQSIIEDDEISFSFFFSFYVLL